MICRLGLGFLLDLVNGMDLVSLSSYCLVLNLT